MTELEYSEFLKGETDLEREAEIIFLEHYGVKGMRWGIRRTPEQLGYKTKTKKKKSSLLTKMRKSAKKKKQKTEKKKETEKQESREELREKVLKSSDPKFIYKHMELLDNKELEDRLQRINKETRMKELANPKKKEKIKTAEDWLKSAASMAESVNKIYDAYNKVAGDSSKGKSDKKNEDKDEKKKKDSSKDRASYLASRKNSKLPKSELYRRSLGL